MSISVPVEKLKSIQVVDYLKSAFELYKNNLSTLFLGFLIAFALTVCTLGILGGAMMAGFIRLCSKIAKPIPGETEAPKPTDVFDGFKVFLPALLLFISVVIINFVLGSVLGIFGSLGGLVNIVLNFVIGGAVGIIAMPLIAFEKTTSVVEAIKAAVEAIKAAPSQLLLISIAATFLGYIGIIAFGIGILLTFPFTVCVYALVYNDLFRSGEAEEITIM
jgi:hypothetical protein